MLYIDMSPEERKILGLEPGGSGFGKSLSSLDPNLKEIASTLRSLADGCEKYHEKLISSNEWPVGIVKYGDTPKTT